MQVFTSRAQARVSTVRLIPALSGAKTHDLPPRHPLKPALDIRTGEVPQFFLKIT